MVSAECTGHTLIAPYPSVVYPYAVSNENDSSLPIYAKDTLPSNLHPKNGPLRMEKAKEGQGGPQNSETLEVQDH